MNRTYGKSTNTFLDAMVLLVVVSALIFTTVTVSSTESTFDDRQMGVLKCDANLNVKEVQRITAMTNDDVCDDCDDDGDPSGQNKQPTATIYSIQPNPAHEYDEISFEGYGEDADGTVIGYKWESSIDALLNTNPTFAVTTLHPGIHTITFTVQDDKLAWSKPVNRTLEITENQAPIAPIIAGEKKGATGEEQDYSFITTDPEDHHVYYYIDWGDGSVDEWIGPYESDEEVTNAHAWDEKGTYALKAKARDEHGAESEWSLFEVQMPFSRGTTQNFIPFLYKLFLRFIA